MSTSTNYTTYDPADSAVSVREVVQRDGLFAVEMPISSDAVARDGDAFDETRLEGFRAQINDGGVPLMIDHGKSELGGGEARYSQLGRIGTVENAEISRDGSTTLLTADLMIADPDNLAEEEGDTGEIEAALRWIRYQASLGMLAASVGWSENLGDRAEDVPGDAELLEVSLTAVPSDSTATQPDATASTDPPEVAARGFEALPSANEPQTQSIGPSNEWWYRDHDKSTDAERVTDALDALEHVREFHTQDGDVPPWKRREKTPPELAAIDELRRQLGHESNSIDVSDRIEELTGDSRRATDERDDVLARLGTIEDHARKLAKPERSYHGTVQNVSVYPFGGSMGESQNRITDAVETIRDVLTEDTEFEGWGMAALEGQ